MVLPEKHTAKWQYVNQRRIALERELGKDFSKCKDVVKLIGDVGLRRTIFGFIPCYEGMVIEFVVSVRAKVLMLTSKITGRLGLEEKG